METKYRVILHVFPRGPCFKNFNTHSPEILTLLSVLKDIDSIVLAKNEVVGDLLHNLGRFYFYSFVFFSLFHDSRFFYRFFLSLFLKNQFLLQLSRLVPFFFFFFNRDGIRLKAIIDNYIPKSER